MRQRIRLTVTLPKELLDKIDALVDGFHVRNRSHAVERLVASSLKPSLETAVILAGGKLNKNKTPLKKINDQYLLSLMLEELKQYGIKKVIFCAGEELCDEVFLRFGDGQTLGIELVYSKENEALGTAGALKFAHHLLPKMPFLVVHGDVLTKINLHDFMEFHIREAGLATIAVKPRLSERSFGRVLLQGNKITDFLSTGGSAGISIVNTGLYVIDDKVLGLIKPNNRVFLETDIFPKLAKKGLLNAFIFQGLWYDVSSKETTLQASKEWLI